MYTNFFFLFSKAFPAMDYKTIISNKRRRKDNESSAVKYKSKEDGSNSAASASSSNTPSWAANTNKNSIIPSSNLVYGQCSNVSQRYEKLGRIGEGTYGMYALSPKNSDHSCLAACDDSSSKELFISQHIS